MIEQPKFLSTLPPSRGKARLALAVVAVSFVIFLAAVPFAKLPLPPIPAFIPIYESALVVNDLITAVLLLGQFSFRRSLALLILASGYLFTAFITVAHALTFPGVFSPSGLLGAGPHSTAWMYMFWHGGFPLIVIAYGLLKDTSRSVIVARPGTAIAFAIGVVLIVVCAITLLATAGQNLLPPIMRGNQYAPALIVVVSVVWTMSMLALAVLWWRRPHTMLDIWLMVVMCAWLFDIALAAVLNAGRYDLGFYAGRIYGLLAASFVLMVLLVESTLLHARLVRAHERERAESDQLLEKSKALEAANKELDAFSYSVSHDLRAPLRAIDGYARMLEEDHADRLDAEGRRLLGVVRASSAQMARLIEDLLRFARVGREPLRIRAIALEPLVRQVIDEIHADHAGRAIEFSFGDLGSAQADPGLVKQVLTNLVSNAVKFSRDRNPARVEVGSRPGDAPGAAPVYFVKDNGAGFDMKYYAKLFGVFERLHGANEFPGTGVGLAIVNRIVSRHGGRVWADAISGQGATFHFTLQADAPRQ